MPQTYRVKLSDGREFDVETEGGPPSEQDVLAGLQSSPAPAKPSSQLETPEAPRHPYARIADAAGGAAVDAVKFAGKVLTQNPLTTVADVGKSLWNAQRETYDKANTEMRAGNPVKSALYRTAAMTPVVSPLVASSVERAAKGEGPELIGEAAADVLMGGGAALAGRVARRAVSASARAERAAVKTAKVSAKNEADLVLALPPSKSSPYSLGDLRTAKPYLNEQHAKAPITSTAGLLDAADGAIGEIEGRIGDILSGFPEASLSPGPRVARAVAEAFADNPRKAALSDGLRELGDLPLNEAHSLADLDRIRLQLNAENKAIQKRNNYDQSTARKVDPGFAAREAAARALRDTIYDYLEERGVAGVRELRRDEGALIKVRNAAERQAMTGGRAVAGVSQPGLARRTVAELADKGSTAIGAAVAGPAGAVAGAQVGETLSAAIKGGRRTRDDLVARVFSSPDNRLPSYPSVPPRRPVAGSLPSAPITAGPAPDTSFVRGVPAEPARRPVRGELPPARVVREAGVGPDTSGPITPKLPENITRRAESDQIAALSGKWREAGVRNDLSDNRGVITLHKVIVPDQLRESGIGTRFMTELVDQADADGKMIALTPSTDFGGSSKARLVQFYKRFGFVENKGRNKDFSIGETMYRPPSRDVGK